MRKGKDAQLARVRGINNVSYLIGCESSDTHEEVVCKAERFYERIMIHVERRRFVQPRLRAQEGGKRNEN